MDWTDEQRQRFAELMRAARERTGLKQYEVAEKLDMAHGTISQLERGPFAGMRWMDVTRLLKFYQVPHDIVCAALGLDDSPTASLEVEEYVLRSEVNALPPEQRDEVLRVVRLLVRGLRGER